MLERQQQQMSHLPFEDMSEEDEGEREGMYNEESLLHALNSSPGHISLLQSICFSVFVSHLYCRRQSSVFIARSCLLHFDCTPLPNSLQMYTFIFSCHS